MSETATEISTVGLDLANDCSHWRVLKEEVRKRVFVSTCSGVNNVRIQLDLHRCPAKHLLLCRGQHSSGTPLCGWYGLHVQQNSLCPSEDPKGSKWICPT